MKKINLVVAVAAFVTAMAAPLKADDATNAAAKISTTPFRPPAVPLVVSDPYLSIWSEADYLAGDVTRHWTKHEHSLVSLIRIDGVNYRLMGTEPAGWPALHQIGVQVLPTRTIYDFEGLKLHVTLTFMKP